MRQWTVYLEWNDGSTEDIVTLYYMLEAEEVAQNFQRFIGCGTLKVREDDGL